MDIFDKIEQTKGGSLGKYQSMAHGYFAFPKLEGVIGSHMKFRGKNVLNWSLNDYLGLANNTEVRSSDTMATEQWGLAYPMGPRMLGGQTTEHEKLEDEIASFLEKEDSFVINHGYQAMLSLVDVLCSRFDVIVYDSDCHACVVDSVFLHKAKGGKSFIYSHNDIDNCRKKLQMAQAYIKKTGRNGGILLMTEGVFGLTGDLSSLREIVNLKQEIDFRLLIDDSHGLGVLGAQGKGTAEYYGVLDKVDIIFSTFSKALACVGGVIVSTEKVINFLRYNMRSQIFAKALQVVNVKGIQHRLDIIQKHPEYRENVLRIAHNLQEGLRQNGINIGLTQSPITPVCFECNTSTDEESSLNEALNLVVDLRENYGVFCPVIVYPTATQKMLMLHLIATANHSDEDVEYTIKALSEINQKLMSGEYAKQVSNVFCSIK